ncbi:PapD-like protein [Thamnidium elegans]|nr:PapD-like protein [Thamnidium elegans]
MSVIIEPAEQLEFHGPFTRVSKESLHVKNPGTEAVIFKVKTTAPKQYCVRPNAGRIEPNSEIEVQIILQPFKEELPEDYKCKDKFLVQTAPINESFEQQDISSMWSHVEVEEKASMHQHKIKCVFVGPREEEEQEEVVDQENSNIVSAPIIPEPVTTADNITSSSKASSSVETPAPINTTKEPENPVAPLQSASAFSPAVVANPSVTVSPPTETKPRSMPVVEKKSEIKKEVDANKELNEALQKIKQLEQQLIEAEKENIRSRSNNGRKLPATVQPLDAVHQHLAALEKPSPTEGYPPQVVLAVAALVFIFTYLFF